MHINHTGHRSALILGQNSWLMTLSTTLLHVSHTPHRYPCFYLETMSGIKDSHSLPIIAMKWRLLIDSRKKVMNSGRRTMIRLHIPKVRRYEGSKTGERLFVGSRRLERTGHCNFRISIPRYHILNRECHYLIRQFPRVSSVSILSYLIIRLGTPAVRLPFQCRARWRHEAFFKRHSRTLICICGPSHIDLPQKMSAYTHFSSANDKYVTSFGDKGSLPSPPGKQLIVGMMYPIDARISELTIVQ